MGLDPVCKMDVEPAMAAAHSTYDGVEYYFCATQCKRKFDRDPERYIGETEHVRARAEAAQDDDDVDLDDDSDLAAPPRR